MKFEVLRSKSRTQPFYWRIVAANGKVLASSETYVNKADAVSAANAVKTKAPAAPIVDRT